MTTSDDWLVPLTDRGDLLLYLLPAAGAGPRTYRTWREAAPAGLTVIAVQSPGREQRYDEEPYTHVSSVADQVADHILDSSDRPFGLFGHSTGGAVAHEVAKRLPPGRLQLLTVAGSPPPDLVDTEGAEASDDELLAAVAAWDGTPPALLSDPDFAAAFLPTLRADLAVNASCRKARTSDEVLDVPIISLAGEQDTSAPPDHCRAWSTWTTASFDFHLMPGGHFFVLDEGLRVLEAVADRLRGPLG